ncbi:MAG TPA: hypothetical protein VII99_13000 [Bacteroidia bacterium]
MKTILSSSILVLIAFFASAQNSNSRWDTIANAAFRKNNVLQQWEYKINKKTKSKTLNTLNEFDNLGCLSKTVCPDVARGSGTYGFTEWKYDEKGNMLKFTQGKIDKDSTQNISYCEKYLYGQSGNMLHVEMEYDENENSHVLEKWNYSDNASKKGTEYTILRVRKDTIIYDQSTFAGNEVLMERNVNRYFPKGLSDFTKYNSKNLPVESMSYEKGKVMSHKYINYTYDASGNLTEETSKDAVGKSNEKKKYSKDQIVYTKYDNKGKILSTSTLTLPPAPEKPTLPPPPAPGSSSTVKHADNPGYVKKEHQDKKGNRIVENYLSEKNSKGKQKLISTETYNKKGLLIESSPADGEFTLQYDYVYY